MTFDKYCKEGPFTYDDGAFTVWLNRFDVWKSADKEGKSLCSSVDKESVVFWAREHLNGFQLSWATVTDTPVGDVNKL